MDYKNLTCQVCQEEFRDGDDIVVCPDCGTPVHRACWQQVGHCVNEYRHDTGWSFSIPKPEPEPEAPAFQPTNSSIDEGEDIEQDPNSGMFPGGNVQMGPYGAYPFREMSENGGIRQGYHRIGADEPIGDYKAKEYAAVIQNNSDRYIPKFARMKREGRTTSWNWAAFFFPALWFTYRKMYWQAVVALLLSVILPLLFMNSVVDYYNKSMDFAQQQAVSQSASGDAASQEEIMSDMPESPRVLTVNEYVTMAVQFFVGLFGNYWYMRRCEKLLKRSKSAEAESQGAAMLQKKGGTSTVAVIVALLLMFALSEGMVRLTMAVNTDLATIIWGLFHR